MYFPVLRGKQFELLALRELALFQRLPPTVHPIIEPVRSSLSSLDRCVDTLRQGQVGYSIVLNPSVGDLSDAAGFAQLCAHSASNHHDGLNYALHARTIQQFALALSLGEEALDNLFPLSIIIDARADMATMLPEIHDLVGSRNDVTYVLPGGTRPRNVRILGDSRKVLLDDPFPAEPRNANYVSRPPSVFSDDCIYFADDGWDGFGDFLTAGSGWTVGGFSPRVVAIHWTYREENSGPIMIQHFTSDSNEDVTNVAGKFVEAAQKLARFLDEENIHTLGSETLRAHAENETFPGLGVVKKVSMQNHLELVGSVLVER